MGLLFTYMVKAAAGEQPYTGYYGAWGNSNPLDGAYSGVYELPFFGASNPRARANAIDRLFSASQNVDDWNALAGNNKTNWGSDYLTAVDRRFTSPEAIYDTLSANPDYLEAIRHFANTGSYDKLDELDSVANYKNPNYIGGYYARHKHYGNAGRYGTDYDLADGVGNAQLVMNMYLAEEAQRKKAAEEQQQLARQASRLATSQQQQAHAIAQQPASAAATKQFGDQIKSEVRGASMQSSAKPVNAFRAVANSGKPLATTLSDFIASRYPNSQLTTATARGTFAAPATTTISSARPTVAAPKPASKTAISAPVITPAMRAGSAQDPAKSRSIAARPTNGMGDRSSATAAPAPTPAPNPQVGQRSTNAAPGVRPARPRA